MPETVPLSGDMTRVLRDPPPTLDMPEELARMLAKLGWRMRRANEELYPMANALLD